MEKTKKATKFTKQRTATPKVYVGSFQAIGRQSFEWWAAVAELIDNTLTKQNNTRCMVILDRVNQTITIIDDSIGIKGDDLEEVIAMGKKSNQGKQLLSFSGVGAKAALYFLGNDFEIITKPESENIVYRLTPNFNTGTDSAEKLANFNVSSYEDENGDHPTGTKIVIRDLNRGYPKTEQTVDKMIQMLRATYADYLDSGKLALRVMVDKTTWNIDSLRPLLSNQLNIVDEDLLVGANEPGKEGVLFSTETITNPDGKEKEVKTDSWEIRVKAGWKLHPKVALEYYKETDPKLVSDNYQIRGGSKVNSPYDWSAETCGVCFKTSGIGTPGKGGKILLFNQMGASSRSEGFWCEVELVKGIEPTMIKTGMKQDGNFLEMKARLTEWLTTNGFRSRVKTGYLHLGELEDVRDHFVEYLRGNTELQHAWGINLDTFDQHVITENDLSGGRADVAIYGTKHTVTVECKKECIDGVDVSQAVGYAMEMGSDLVMLVAQKMTKTGTFMQKLWKDKLGIDIIFKSSSAMHKK